MDSSPLITVGVTAWHCRYELSLPRPTCWLLQFLPMEERSRRKVSSCPHGARSGSSHKTTHDAGSREGAGFFLLEQPETQEVVLPWPGGGAAWLTRCCFSCLPSQSVVALVLYVFQAHLPHSPRILSLVSWFWRVVSLLLRGQKSGWCHSQICFYMWYEMAGWG